MHPNRNFSSLLKMTILSIIITAPVQAYRQHSYNRRLLQTIASTIIAIRESIKTVGGFSNQFLP